MICFNNKHGGDFLRRLVICGLLLFLTGCNPAGINVEIDESVDALDEVVPHYNEIEELLAQVELEIGLGETRLASSTFARLKQLIEDHEISTYQQARVNTLEELLSDILADTNNRTFTGSDAAAKVMTQFGSAPDGYEYVYDEISSFVGSSSLGYYIFLVPVERSEYEFEVLQTFFVTDRGEILTFE